VAGHTGPTGHGPHQYTVIQGTATFTPLPERARVYDGTGDGADATVDIALPFAYRFYNKTYPAGATLHLSTKGNIQFGSNNYDWHDKALPCGFDDVILGLWADYAPGVYVQTDGAAPHRVLTVEYRGGYYYARHKPIDMEIRLFEDDVTRYFDVTYNTVDSGIDPGVVGVQEGSGANYTQYEARDAHAVHEGMRLTFYDSADIPPPGLGRLDAIARAVPVGRAPTGLAIDPATGYAFIASGPEGALTTLDAPDGPPLARAAVGRDPVAVAVASQERRVFVANRASDSVSMLDAGDGTVLYTATVGAAPNAIAIDAASGHVFVADSGANTLTVLDGATGYVVGTTRLTGRPAALAVDGATGQVVAATNGPSGAGSVSVLDGASGTLQRTTAIGAGVTALAVAVGADRIVIAGNDGRVRLLDARGGAMRRTVDIVAGLDARTVSLAVDEDKGYVLVAAEGPTGAGGRFVDTGVLRVVDARDGSLIGGGAVGHAPSVLAVDKRLGRAFILDNADNTLTVFDATTL